MVVFKRAAAFSVWCRFTTWTKRDTTQKDWISDTPTTSTSSWTASRSSECPRSGVQHGRDRNASEGREERERDEQIQVPCFSVVNIVPEHDTMSLKGIVKEENVNSIFLSTLC